MKIYTLICCFLFSSIAAEAQLKIRQSFNDDESIQNPAAFSITLPKDKSASYLVDLGLGWQLFYSICIYCWFFFSTFC